MKSQVSFKFEGEHNKQGVLYVLNLNLKGLRYKIEKENTNTYRIYVASEEGEDKTFKVCYEIQTQSIRDYNRDI